jgi:hypothetical protein
MDKLRQTLTGLFLALTISPAWAATVSLLPSSVTVTEGGQFTVDIYIDATDTRVEDQPGSIIGKPQITFDETLVDFVGFSFNSPAVGSGTPITEGTGFVTISFANALDDGVIGTLTFDVLGIAGDTINLGILDSVPVLGSFANTVPVNLKFDPAFNGTNIDVVPIPASAWLFLSGLGWLVFSRRQRAAQG